jgi:hypothetical protein
VLASLRPEGRLYRVAFRLAGPDPRVALRQRGNLAPAERAELDRRLARLDAASRHGPWTFDVLRLIRRRPATRAADLAAELGREKAPFKADVRKLKELGLTESLEVGYRLSRRGQAYLEGALSAGRARRRLDRTETAGRPARRPPRGGAGPSAS